MSPLQAMYAVWIVWGASWFGAALWTGETVERPASGSELPYRIATVLGIVLLLGVYPRRIGVPEGPLWQAGPVVAWSSVAVAASGFAFTWWARLHLGRLWSSSVTKKTGHRVVDTGPYGLVRHPIYTGIIAASCAVVVLKGTMLALAGAIVLTAGWFIKARLEEKFLRQELGADAYDAYAKRVPMLVPFAPV